VTDRTRTREREAEAEAGDTRLYRPKYLDYCAAELHRSLTGRVVVRDRERPWDVSQQAKAKRYLSPHEPDLQDTASQDWEVFLQVIPERSGKHRHQGGLVIFVLEGSGHTIIEGRRHDWEAGDLMLLPLHPAGVEHQHFNHDPEHPAKWVAFVYWPLFNSGGSETTQLENSPIYEAWLAEEKKKNFEAR
jgi:gentisate 1,2-dioxygenase